MEQGVKVKKSVVEEHVPEITKMQRKDGKGEYVHITCAGWAIDLYESKIAPNAEKRSHMAYTARFFNQAAGIGFRSGIRQVTTEAGEKFWLFGEKIEAKGKDANGGEKLYTAGRAVVSRFDKETGENYADAWVNPSQYSTLKQILDYALAKL